MKLEDGYVLDDNNQKLLDVIAKLHGQQRFMHDNKTHSVEDRIVSIGQPHLRPIVRGKAAAPVEFGAKLDRSMADGYGRIEKISLFAKSAASAYQGRRRGAPKRTPKPTRNWHMPTASIASRYFYPKTVFVFSRFVCKICRIKELDFIKNYGGFEVAA